MKSIVRLCLFLLITISSNLIADTNVCGWIDTNTTLTLAGSPYIVTCTTAVSSGITLTIEPGVIVKFFGTGLNIYGTLTAIGTESSPIIFTSSSVSPAPGDWKAIYFYSTSSASRISYANLSYGGYINPEIIGIDGSSPVLDHLTISHSLSYGVNTRNGASPTLDSVTVTNCNHSGLGISGWGLTTVTNSNLSSNVFYGVNVGGGGSLNISSSTLSNNGSYAIGTEAGTVITTSALTLSGNGNDAKNGIEHRGGTITGTENWKAGVDRFITNNPTVASGATLIIDPGAVIKLSGAGIYVFGTLTAIGTAQSPIVFTSAAASPAPGNWKAVYFHPGSSGRISYANLSYGGYDNPEIIGINGSSPTLDHLSISNSLNHGITTSNSASPLIEHVTISNCNLSAISSGAGANPVIRSSNFNGNQNGIANSDASIQLNAAFNYWNSSTGPSGSGGGTGQAVSANVIFDPWLISSSNTDHYFASGSVANKTFNPRDDIFFQLSFITNVTGNWTVMFRDLYDQPVRTFTGTSLPAAVSWDGTDEQGALLLDGAFSYTVQNNSGGQPDLLAFGYAIVDGFDGEFTVTQNVSQFSVNGGSVTYTTGISRTITHTLVIKNESGQVVRTLFQGSRYSGNYNDLWDGKNDQGAILPDGPYFFVSTFTETIMGGKIIDLTKTYKPNAWSCHYGVAGWDPFNNNPMRFNYSFELTGRVSLILSPTFVTDPITGVPATCVPPNYCHLDRKYQEAGAHSITWSGVDQYGNFRTDIKGFSLCTMTFDFSENAVVLYGSKPVISDGLVTVAPPVYDPTRGNQTINFSISTFQNQPVNVVVKITGHESHSTLRTISLSNVSPGAVSIPWDGKADNGMWIAPGGYAVKVKVTDSIGNEVTSEIVTMIRYWSWGE